MSLGVNITSANVAAYYQSVPNYNAFLVASIVEQDPVLLANYQTWLTSRTDSAINTPASS